MPKQLKFDEEARASLLKGVNILAQAVTRAWLDRDRAALLVRETIWELC